MQALAAGAVNKPGADGGRDGDGGRADESGSGSGSDSDSDMMGDPPAAHASGGKVPSKKKVAPKKKVKARQPIQQRRPLGGRPDHLGAAARREVTGGHRRSWEN